MIPTWDSKGKLKSPRKPKQIEQAPKIHVPTFQFCLGPPWRDESRDSDIVMGFNLNLPPRLAPLSCKYDKTTKNFYLYIFTIFRFWWNDVFESQKPLLWVKERGHKTIYTVTFCLYDFQE